MIPHQIKTWLLEGDVAIQYQVHRDLLGAQKPELQKRIATEGWGARLLQARQPNGHWGRGFYQPKWISTHYSLLDLKYLQLPPDHPYPSESIAIILRENKSEDGGVNPARSIAQSDVCVNGMFLNYACYFKADPEALRSIVDYVITQHMPDGGFNCRFNLQGAVHSSLHSTISLLEGMLAYETNGYTYRLPELKAIAAAGREFILQHALFCSDRTGAIINKRFLMLSYPSRWFYDILRALDYFQAAGCPYDPRMQPALDVLAKKRRRDDTWPVQAKHAGQTHFEMETTGGPSRWNTLRALRVLDHFAEGIREFRPEKSCLLVLDVQKNMFAETFPVFGSEALLDRLEKLIAGARQAGMAVVYARNNGGPDDPDYPGTEGWALHPRLAPQPGEIVLDKHTPDAFAGTSLAAQLEKRAITRLFVAGMQSESCVQGTSLAGWARGYPVVVVADAHTTFDFEGTPARETIAKVNAALSSKVMVLEHAALAF